MLWPLEYHIFPLIMESDSPFIECYAESYVIYFNMNAHVKYESPHQGALAKPCFLVITDGEWEVRHPHSQSCSVIYLHCLL